MLDIVSLCALKRLSHWIRVDFVPLINCGSDCCPFVVFFGATFFPNASLRSPTVLPCLFDFTVQSCENLDCASFSCSIPETNFSQVNVTFRVWKPTFIKVGLTGHMGGLLFVARLGSRCCLVFVIDGNRL